MMSDNQRSGMLYIPNKALYAATMWARRMMHEDKVPADTALKRAAFHYQVPVGDVASECLHVGASLKVRKSAISPRWRRT